MPAGSRTARRLLAAGGVATLVACGGERDTPAVAPLPGTPTLVREVVVGGLSNPWDLAFAPTGEVFFSERGRGIAVRLRDGTVRRFAPPADFVAQGQSGMLGLALDPRFAETRQLYAFMASSLGGPVTNRIVRWRVAPDFSALEQRTDVVTGLAYAGGAHSGGRIRFGPDGHLWIATGDNLLGRVPQDLQSTGGKVLRVTRDGAAAPGNPTGWPRPADPRLFATGFRNVQGLSFRPADGEPYISEHGPGRNDEVTRVRAGGNGGWDPVCPDGTSYCGYEAGMSMTDTVRFPTALRPAFRTGASEGMSGSTWLDGPAWREWNGALAVVSLSGRRLRLLRVAADGASSTVLATLYDGEQRLRAAVQGPDGALYLLTDEGGGRDEIRRVVPGAPRTTTTRTVAGR
jgi:glucose/arabinose dehydrogenase